MAELCGMGSGNCEVRPEGGRLGEKISGLSRTIHQRDVERANFQSSQMPERSRASTPFLSDDIIQSNRATFSLFHQPWSKLSSSRDDLVASRWAAGNCCWLSTNRLYSSTGRGRMATLATLSRHPERRWAGSREPEFWLLPIRYCTPR